MGTRRQAREYAMQRIYRKLMAPPASDAFPTDLGDDVVQFGDKLVDGVDAHVEEIDKVLSSTSNNWKVGRMAAVDKSILRLAVYELMFEDDIPFRVSINEAIELAKKFGGEGSGSFVNGILDKIAKTLKTRGEGK